MSETKNSKYNHHFLFGKQNFIWVLIGLGVMILGFILMMGGNSDPSTFDEDAIYSFRRITLAPILILIGLGVQIYAIFKKSPDLDHQELEASE